MKKMKAIIVALGVILISTFSFAKAKPVSQINTTKMEKAVAKAAFGPTVTWVDGFASGPYINWTVVLDQHVTTTVGYGIRVYYYNNPLYTQTNMVLLSGQIPAGSDYATPQSLGGFNYYGVEHFEVVIIG